MVYITWLNGTMERYVMATAAMQPGLARMNMLRLYYSFNGISHTRAVVLGGLGTAEVGPR